MNKMEILEKAVINGFSYHDALIIDFKKSGADFLLTFKDGWNDGQINEIRMLNAEVVNKYDLKDREIYQLGFIDFNDFSLKKCFLEIYVWYDDCLTEVVKFEAEDFISKVYFNGELLKEESLCSLFDE